MATLILATLNPKDVAAQEVDPPKVYADGIVSELFTPSVAVSKLEVKEMPLKETKPLYIAPVAAVATTQSIYTVRGTSSGNSYSPGYCTFYAKNMRPDLPNNLGNADTWYSRAAAQGLSVGSTPRAGAIGETKAYMHVVYIESVHGDTVTVSEMNYKGRGVVSKRTAPASEFRYIY